MNPRNIAMAAFWLMVLGGVVLVASKFVGVTASKTASAL